jgi:hypothetical protein
LIFFTRQEKGSECRIRTIAKKTTKVNELKII